MEQDVSDWLTAAWDGTSGVACEVVSGANNGMFGGVAAGLAHSDASGDVGDSSTVLSGVPNTNSSGAVKGASDVMTGLPGSDVSGTVADPSMIISANTGASEAVNGISDVTIGLAGSGTVGATTGGFIGTSVAETGAVGIPSDSRMVCGMLSVFLREYIQLGRSGVIVSSAIGEDDLGVESDDPVSRDTSLCTSALMGRNKDSAGGSEALAPCIDPIMVFWGRQV